MTHKILVLFANPKGSNPLRLSAEDRIIRECFERSKHRDKIQVEIKHAATIHDFRRALLDDSYSIVHFSGHGTGQGLAFEDDFGEVKLISPQALATFLADSTSIQCLILNACYTDLSGELFSKYIPYTIGMQGAISNTGAMEFTRGFYDAIGAGKNIEKAFMEGCGTIKLLGLPDEMVPQIFKKENLNVNNSPVYRDVLKKFIEQWKEKLGLAKRERFTFLLVGRTGVGKSSTINSLMGKAVAKVGDWEATTLSVISYDSDISGIKFTVIDTPGLCDDLPDAGNDEKYLDLIKSKITELDSVWFVSRLDETRVSSDEKRGIKLITQALGDKVWEHALIVFTFANSIMTEISYQETFQKRTDLIRREIAKYASSEVADKVPSVAVDNKKEVTPDGDEWLGQLYATVFAQISDKGALPFFLATAQRIKQGEIPLTSEQKDTINDKLSVTAFGMGGGAILGGLLGGPAGFILGGLLGLFLGILASLTDDKSQEITVENSGSAEAFLESMEETFSEASENGE